VKLQFALNLPLEFRRMGADSWLSGYTEKMGSSGVVFRAAQMIEPKTRIEMVFRMPVSDPCNLVCTGTVLRVDLPGTSGTLPAISATIEQYSFVRF
jgi:hypothetical protein